MGGVDALRGTWVLVLVLLLCCCCCCCCCPWFDGGGRALRSSCSHVPGPVHLQDKRDDIKVGIKSTALTFGDRTKAICGGFAAAQAGLLCAAGAALGAGAPYYAGVAAATAHVAWQLVTVDLDDARDCMSKFVSNRITGGLLFAGIIADRLVAAGGAEAAAAVLA